jgi:hypothetical protein
MSTFSIRSTGKNVNAEYRSTRIRSYSSSPPWPSSSGLDIEYGKYTVDSGADLNVSNYISDKTPMQYATVTGHTSGSALADAYANSWSAVNTTTVDGVTCLDLATTDTITMSSPPVFGQNYTMFAGWYPRVSDSGWRTFWRGDNDHNIIVQDGTKNLGMYSNRNGAFQDSGHDITINWQSIIVVGYGDSSTASTGTQNYYIDGVHVGSVSRTVSGTNSSSFGHSTQGPGYFTEFGFLNQALTAYEINQLNARLQLSMGFSASLSGWTENNVVSNRELSNYTKPNISFKNTQSVVSTRPITSATVEEKRVPILSTSKIVPYDITELKKQEGSVKTTTATRSIVSVEDDGTGGTGGPTVVVNEQKQIWY